ncbi:glycoside hydrolase family 30 protein [Virgibacillus proomii]|uniref:glycoside hydrolase family 30 protein n=1 Tax=Virgibacillus proomii TaxID=84407 RepID=UPI00098499F6|nr:glycoside hydrolase family 30 beta sandwich domain-containing protein [Virgibacillus proomii]
MKGTAYFSDVNQQFKKVTVDFKQRETDNNQVLKVFSDKTRQKVYGFGSSFTEASGSVYNKMPDSLKQAFIESCFGETGNKYNLVRMPIQSCDFSLGNYAYLESEEDLQQSKVNFDRDKENIIPVARDAVAANPETIFMASPWSPPAFMKTNNNMNGGGYLKEEYYEDWAKLIKLYLDIYKENGIHVQKLSVQNEPVAVKQWDSCLYTNEQEAYFAVKVLKKILSASGYDHIELYIWDHDKDGLIEWADQTFRNSEYRHAIDGIAFHWYTGDHFEQISYLAKAYPEKDLLFTEGCVPQEGFDHNTQEKHGKVYIHDLIGNFKHGMNAFIDWNILLDMDGGPNHMGNTCEAPIQYDGDNQKLHVNLSYYYIGHFSRFVKKGAHVVYSSAYDHSIEQVAFINPEGGKVLVAYNASDDSKAFRVIDKDVETSIELAAKQVVTLIWK